MSERPIPNCDCLCAGILVADHVCAPVERMPGAGELVMAQRIVLHIGGCASNAAIDLAKLGVRTGVVGRVGEDVYGGFVRDTLQEHGVETSGLIETPGTDTSQTLIVNVKGQDRRFVHSFGANAQFTGADLPPERVRGAKVLYVGGYLLMPNLSQADLVPVFEAARGFGVKTVLDVAIPEPGDYLSRLDRLLPLTDYFLPNNDEARMILGVDDPLEQAERFHRMGAGTAVVTCGERGAVLVSGETRLRAGVYPVEFVDGTGGGDAFDAGFIYGILQGFDLATCLRWGSALGASCVRAIGTTTGVLTRPEAEAFIAERALRIERV
jgi:sugar/nucleoside kinase (ribokinase family)